MAALFRADQRFVDRRGQEHRCNPRLRSARFVGLYFSATWCPPCQEFDSLLAAAYERLSIERPGAFEVVYLNHDRRRDAFWDHFQRQPWLAVPYEDSDEVLKLRKLLGVTGIPRLLIVENAPNCRVLTTKGRKLVIEEHTTSFEGLWHRLVAL